MTVKQDIKFRVYVAFTCISLLGLAVFIKAARIQTVQGKELRAISMKTFTRRDSIPAERGNIYSEDGELLCSSLPEFDCYIDFSVIKADTFKRYADTLSRCVAKLFHDQPANHYLRQFKAAYRDTDQYYELKKGINFYNYMALRQFPIFNKGSRKGGLLVFQKTQRVNPYGVLAYRTIGLYRENSQQIGLEATYDSLLKGTPGNAVLQKQTGGVWMPVEGSEVPALNGKDIETTINLGIQNVAEQSLKQVLAEYECKYGTCIVMEVKTGKIRALANLGRRPDGSYWEDFNYALSPTEPGSTFKLATLLSLLEDNYVKITDMVNPHGGAYRFGNRTMHDSHAESGSITIEKAFAISSNVSMAILANTYYYKDPQQYINHLKALHLDRRTGIDILGERAPKVRGPQSKDWNKEVSLPWMATGYGVLISPMHTCMLYNAVANDGKMMKPYLITAIRDYNKEVKVFTPTVVEERIAGPQTVKQLKKCMEEVVEHGTAAQIKSPNYKIAGKTGTAQVFDKGIKYTDGVYQGSFSGYFPADDPKYTITVVIRTKAHSRAFYGAQIAAPIFRLVADKIYASEEGQWKTVSDSLSIAMEHKWLGKPATADAYSILLQQTGLPFTRLNGNKMYEMKADTNVLIARKYPEGVVPDVTGMGLKDALYILEKRGFQVQMNGAGIIRYQSIPAGSPIIKGKTINLLLS